MLPALGVAAAFGDREVAMDQADESFLAIEDEIDLHGARARWHR